MSFTCSNDPPEKNKTEVCRHCEDGSLHNVLVAHSERAAVDDAVALLPVPRKAFGHHFHFASAILRFYENCELRLTALTLQD